MTIYKFPSVTDFAKECAKIKDHRMSDSEAKSWTGSTYNESLQGAIYGSQEYLDKAYTLMDKLYTAIDIPQPQWTPSVMGAYPSVGDYLANDPEPMRVMECHESEKETINIYYVLSSSAGVSHEDLLKRGIATLAMAAVLAKNRPVALKLVGTLDGKSPDKCTLLVIDVDLANLNLASVSYAIAGTGFDRNLMHTYATHHNGFSGHWAWFSYPESDNYWNNLRKALNIGNNDMVIKGAFLTDELIQKDPVQWCKNQMAKYLTHEHDDAEVEALKENMEEFSSNKKKFSF